MMLTDKGQAFVTMVLDAFAEAVAEAGDLGIPGGSLYAAFMQTGLGLREFELVMGKLVKDGRVVKRGQCYFGMARRC